MIMQVHTPYCKLQSLEPSYTTGRYSQSNFVGGICVELGGLLHVIRKLLMHEQLFVNTQYYRTWYIADVLQHSGTL